MADLHAPSNQPTPIVIDPSLDPAAFRELCHADQSIPIRIVYTNRSYRYPTTHSYFSR